MINAFRCLLLLLLFSTFSNAQTAYIQVNGEPDLGVYLNGDYKGKTTAEYKGLIIDNVSAGKNLVKIVKEGFTPYEETITVKPGEVFAYTVKPFTKHLVQISEKGNSDETDKKATIKTGKLIIQSVPIEIKITMPDIEGVTNSQKSKDEWVADKIPTGNYEITFAYGPKVITKNVTIESDKVTGVFVNMLNGEFVVKTKLTEKQQRKQDSLTVIRTMDSLCRVYKFKRGLYESSFRSYNPEAAALIAVGGGEWTNSANTRPTKRDKTAGPYTYFFYLGRPVIRYTHILNGEPLGDNNMRTFYNAQLAYYKKLYPEKYIRIQADSFSIYNFAWDFEIQIYYNRSGTGKAEKYSYVEIIFRDSKTYPRQ